VGEGVIKLKKIGKTFKSCAHFLSLFFCLIATVYGSEIEVTLSVNETSPILGEEFTLQVRVQGAQSVDDIRLENTDQFSIARRGSSTSAQGTFSKLYYVKTVTYALYPKKEGSFSIGPAVVEVDGKEYKSEQINLEVQRDHTGKNSQFKGQRRRKDIFLEGKVNNLLPFVGEQIIYTFRLYFRVQFGNHQVEIPEFKGLWKEKLGKEKNYRKVIKGEEWNVFEVHYALFPLNPGKVIIDKSAFQAVVFTQDQGSRGGGGSLFDDLMNGSFSRMGFGRRKKINLSSKPIELQVRPLPGVGKPAHFSGLIGNFKIGTNLEKKTLTQGESSTLTVTIQGRGNIFDAKIGDIDIPGFKIYQDKPTLKTSPSSQGLTGKRVFKMALVPQKAGNLEIPPFKLNYFDSQSKEYKLVQSDLLKLKVRAAKSGEEEKIKLVSPSKDNSLSKRNIKVQGHDLMPLKKSLELTSGVLSSKEKIIFWILLCLFPIIYVATYFRKRRNDRFSQNSGLRRQEQALRKFQKGLKGVEEGQSFVMQASSVFRDYIGDKVNIDGKALTPLDLDRVLGTRQIENKTIEDIKELLQDFEKAQYGGKMGSLPSKMVSKMENIVKNMEKELR
jgi:hypothetical protein